MLINLGRGDVVSEETIVKAIGEGWLGGAILDVFEQEPLPAESKLWGMPQVIITPHISALATINEVTSVSCPDHVSKILYFFADIRFICGKLKAVCTGQGAETCCGLFKRLLISCF